jgi:cholesterol transport system auxiliary component
MTSPISARLALAIVATLLAGCASVVDKPVRPTLYDFGSVPLAGVGVTTPVPATTGTAPVPASPGLATASAASIAQRQPLPPLVIADIEGAGALDGSAVLYRLGYANANELRAYALARWSAPPPQLVRQRLREQLGRERPVLNLGESASLVRESGVLPHVLRLELEEFVHVFDAPERSHGALRLRATLLANTAAGERLLGQRSIAIDRPAASHDAPGGVRALTAATDAAAAEISLWLHQVR